MKRLNPKRGGQTALVLLSMLLLCREAAVALPLVGRIDDFQDGTAMGWAGGQPAYTMLFPVIEGGPLGENDAFLQVSVAGFHLGTKTSNRAWTGDYLSCGVTAIEMDLAPLDANPDLRIRLLLFGPGGAFATRTHFLPASLPRGSWTHASFSVKAADLIYVSRGTGRVEDTLSQVTTLLIRHDLETPTLPGNHPPHITASIGIDNIEAVLRPYDVAWTFGATNSQSYVLDAFDGFEADQEQVGREDPTLMLHLWKRYQVTVPDYATHPFEIIAKGPDPSTDTVLLSMKPNAVTVFQDVPEIQWENDGQGTASFIVTDTLLTFMSALPGQRPGYRCANHAGTLRGDFIGCTRSIPADVNGDCVVSILDIDKLLEEWLACYAQPAGLCP